MEANIIFENVKAYNVNKFDVRLGETFKVQLVDAARGLRWFSDNDPVLSVRVDSTGEEATITATGKGECDIQLQSNNEIVMILQVEVYDNIATSLNPTVGESVLK